ncbi:MAG: hypothetical protein ACLQGJ_05500 [Candidatus Dormibacteria bacterium]
MPTEPLPSEAIRRQAALGDAPATLVTPGGQSALGTEEATQPDLAPAGTAAPSAVLVASPGEAALTLGSGEIRQFATQLATQLFERWELALQGQFRAELGLRLEAELEHREQEARQLREEVQERQQRFDNPWPTRNGAWGHATWEMENTIRRQASELAETERQMTLLRQRLLELGRAPEEVTVTVAGQWEASDFEGSVHQPSDEKAGGAPADLAGTGRQGEAA